MPYPDLRTENAIKRLRRLVGALRVESPIEAKLYPALVALAETRRCYVRAQYKLKKFRYDFAIFDVYHRVVALVECDGKAFHETPSQRRRDKQKDKIARDLRLPLFRFVGADIWADPFKCAEQIANRYGW